MDSEDEVKRAAVALPDGRSLAVEVVGPRPPWERTEPCIEPFVREVGPGRDPPIVLLRPLGGTIELWGQFREALAERARVITFDHAGAGRSSDAPLGFGTRAMARDALAVLDQLNVERAHVFGVSLGGMVATWLAIDAPDRVARVCLASAAPSGLDLSLQGIGRAASLAACVLRPAASVQACLVRSVLSSGVRRAEPGRAARLAAPMDGRPARRAELVKQGLAAIFHDASYRLHSIRAPVLVLAGERDELLGLAPQRALARAIPGARLQVIPGAGHALTLEAPWTTAAAVLRFFFEEG